MKCVSWGRKILLYCFYLLAYMMQRAVEDDKNAMVLFMLHIK